MAYIPPDQVRCRDCGHIGFAGISERWARPGEVSDAHYMSRPVKWDDCCERCASLDVTTVPTCARCGINDATDDDHCHTCAIEIDTDDLVCAQRSGVDRISDLHWTVMECARGLR